MMNNHLEKFIDKQKVSFVTSVDEEGFPNIKAMLKPRKKNGLILDKPNSKNQRYIKV